MTISHKWPLVVAAFAMTLFVCLPASAGADCLGDCDRDGTVTVDEILAGVAVALGLVETSRCPGFDGNGDVIVQVDEILGAVDHALHGCPAPGPTATPTPTRTPSATPTPLPEDPAERVIALAAPRVCWIGGDSVEGGGVERRSFYCFTAGHGGNVRLSGPHAEPPVIDPNGPEVVEFAGGMLRIRESPHPSTGAAGLVQTWIWWRDCWRLDGYVSDDTTFRLPPQPHESIGAVVEAAGAVGLFDLCPSTDPEDAS
jgi:hypothetical protein